MWLTISAGQLEFLGRHLMAPHFLHFHPNIQLLSSLFLSSYRRQQIMAALNAQTAVQFQQYAAQQYPNSPEQQVGLIRQLQEQHYQQYMQQLYQVQLAQQQV